ncbi:MAG: hypothetical protein JJU30_02705 [Alkalimonas sp.]|nr:hypothetical protein [Alkalimonas sp.]
MFASSLVIAPSRWRRYSLLWVLALALMSALLVPLSGFWLVLYGLAGAAFGWCWWGCWQQQEAACTLLLGEQGELRWLPAGRAAGSLQQDSLVLPWAILLRWRGLPEKGHPRGQLHRYWLLADQCSDDDFRALARAIRQCRWQQAEPAA